jgi:cobalt-zinc-cadmium efflux system outer membrane protein
MKLVKAYQALLSAYTEATELDKNVLQGAESVFEASKTGYSRGKLDYLNVLDAQRTLFEAKARYIDALTSYHTAKADVERLIGCSIDGETLLQSED